MKTRLVPGVVAGLMLAYLPAAAHHSFAATYIESESMTVTGTVVQFLFRNPHSFVQIDVPDEKGKMQRWAVEWGSVGQLGNAGISRDTLKTGDEVQITGNPGRVASEHRLRLTKIARKNGEALWGARPGEVFTK